MKIKQPKFKLNETIIVQSSARSTHIIQGIITEAWYSNYHKRWEYNIKPRIGTQEDTNYIYSEENIHKINTNI